MDVDPAFRSSRQKSRRRRARRRATQIGLILGGCLALAAVGVGVFTIFDRAPPSEIATNDLPADSDAIAEAFVQIEDTSETTPVRVAHAFADIPGDPMILRFETLGTATNMQFSGPDSLDVARVGRPTPTRLTLVRDSLLVQQQQLITALPSSREDFAFFQAQQGQSIDLSTLSQPEPTATSDEDLALVTIDEDGASYGVALDGADGDAPSAFRETRIENTTSIAFVVPEGRRTPIYRDVVVRLETVRPLAQILRSNGVERATADDFAADAAVVFDNVDGLPEGTIVALRGQPMGEALLPLQLSLYGPNGFIDSVARRGFDITRATDPWIEENLVQLASRRSLETPDVPQEYRLLDAIYSALIRNGVSTTTVGETIVMLSQSHDLEALAAPGDSVTLLFAPLPGDLPGGPERILYAAVTGSSTNIECYVGAEAQGNYSCFGKQGRAGSAGGAMTTPVQGTLSSPFGPRFHPILKEVRLHAGVDWAAPTGTPVVSAWDGTVRRVGDGGGYGNVVYVDHAASVQTRYAHLSRFADGLRPGQQVRAGQVIGYVGTTGRSTGPHLHFEVRRGGQPVDPFTVTLQPSTPGATAPAGGLTASAAVEALTNQIIQVESAGNANAKNPLSTATGLGQFIESTWLRMMRDYRPDLYNSMSRAALLDLRRDPTLSREMVINLARENENFLRARGHAITPGRLYLAHFLGPGGAHKVLSSNDSATILAVMGSGVVRANPFLRNYTVADLKAWADRKMRGSGSATSVSYAPARPVLTQEMRDYIGIIDRILEEPI